MTREEGGFFIIFLTRSGFPREDDLGCEVSAFPTPGRSWIPSLPMAWEGILGARPGGHCPSHLEPGSTREPQQFQRAWNSLRIELRMPR